MVVYAGSCHLTAKIAVIAALCALFMFNFLQAILSHVLGIRPQERMLQSETGRQRDPKEGRREGTHRSFYPDTQGLLHRKVFTQRRILHKEGFTQRFFYSKVLLQATLLELLPTEIFTRRSLYTEGVLDTHAFAHRFAVFCASII